MLLYGTSGITPETADAVIAEAERGLTAKTPKERVPAVLCLVNQFYVAGGELDFLGAAQRSQLFEILSQALDAEEATVAGAMWALSWLCKSRYRDANDRNLVYIPTAIARRIEAILQRPDVDAFILADGANILTREEGIEPIFGQQDWIYNLALIADGGSPRRRLKEIKPCGRTTSIDWLADLVISRNLPKSGRDEASALGALGVFRCELVGALATFARRKEYTTERRSEAILYLAMTGTPEAADELMDFADTPDEEEDDILYSRGLFGLLYLDDVDILAAQIRKRLPHSDLKAYAFGLAGSSDPRGRNLLEELCEDPDTKVREAARAALDNPKLKPE
jgi:hypothetical protein